MGRAILSCPLRQEERTIAGCPTVADNYGGMSGRISYYYEQQMGREGSISPQMLKEAPAKAGKFSPWKNYDTSSEQRQVKRSKAHVGDETTITSFI